MRYLLFGGKCYYAQGGMHDFLAHSNDLESLLRTAKKHDPKANKSFAEYVKYPDVDWWHIFDTKAAKIVAGTHDQAYMAPDIKGGEK